MADGNGFDEWGGYMAAKVTKLEEQFEAASAPFRKSNLFAGISIYVNGLTNPSSDELKRIMCVHGGVYHHYERSHTTYIIASNLPDVKVRNMDTSKIVSAQWVVDCVEAKRILDYTKYLLYTNQKTTQPRLNFLKKPQKQKESNTNETAAAEKQKIEELDTIKQELAELNVKILKSKVESEKIQNNSNPAEDKNNVQKEQKPSSTSTSTSVARTAVDPKFLPEFYNNSRLHHIATLGADLKQYVTELREKHVEVLGFPARQKLVERLGLSSSSFSLKNEMAAAHRRQYIMHIDMDCFFVSVGLRNNPHLRGQPVAVTHSKGGASASEVPVHPQANREAEMELFAKRFEQHLHNNILSDKVRNGFDAKMSLSEIASCSYEARSKGIRNGMFVGQALKLCAELKTIPYDFDGYKEVAYTLYDTIAQYTLCIEAVSCDEMFVDLSDVIDELKIEPMDFVRAIRNEICKKTGCPCSAGVGGNKLQARLATRRAKPDGQFYLAAEEVEAYMANIPAADLPGVGASANYALKKAGYVTCGDLQQLQLTKLQSLLGKKCGETLHQFCRGIDNRSLQYEQLRKSVSAEVNYGIRFKAESEVTNFLRQLCAEVHSRLCHIKRKTKCITLKVMIRAADAPIETSKFMGHGVCDYITKSETLLNFTNDLEVITRSILTIMKNLNKPPQELRGIGIQLTKLDQPVEAAGKISKDNSIKNMFSKLEEKRKESNIQPIRGDGNKRDMTQIMPKAGTIDSKQQPNTRKRPNVLSMLQQTNAKKLKEEAQNKLNEVPQNLVTSTSEDFDLANLPADIDLEVFAALPIDIRKEIINDSRRSRGGAQVMMTASANDFKVINNDDGNKNLMKTNKNKTSTSSIPPPIVTTASSNSLATKQPAIEEELDFTPSTSRAARERDEAFLRQREPPQQELPQDLLDLTPNNNNKETNQEIDPQFLEALPPDIRAEIEANMAAVKKHSAKVIQQVEKEVEVTDENLNHNNNHQPTICTDDCCQFVESRQVAATATKNLFMQSNCKEMLLQWTKTEIKPMAHDVQLCCRYARDMIPDNLNILYDSLSYLRQLVAKKLHKSIDDRIGQSWLKAYTTIAEAASKACEQHFGRRLLTRDI